MRTNRLQFRRWSRVTALAVVVGAAASLTGCGDWLAVTNPGAIDAPDLENAEYLQLMYDGVVGDFQPAFAWTAFFTSSFTDELRMHHAYFENLEMDQRRVTENNGTYALSVFNGLHRARFMAETVADQYSTLLGDTATHDLRLAKTLAFGAYSWALLGENICETRIDAQGDPLQPNQLFTGAIDRFEDAIAAATTARANASNIEEATTRDRVIAGADSVINWARVGAARAALNRGDMADAIAYASAVEPAYDDPDAFQWDAHYRRGDSFGETRRMGNPFWEFISAGGSWVSLSGTGYEELDDPRVPHQEAGARSVAGGGSYLVPNSPPSFSTYDGSVEGAPFESTSSIRIASALEARYILAEAEGNTPDNVDFLNDQIAIGGGTPLVDPTDGEYLAALREQRAREFFIDGHRLGDLRRYQALYGEDDWPSGAMYGGEIEFGSQKCWPTPFSELF